MSCFRLTLLLAFTLSLTACAEDGPCDDVDADCKPSYDLTLEVVGVEGAQAQRDAIGGLELRPHPNDGETAQLWFFASGGLTGFSFDLGGDATTLSSLLAGLPVDLHSRYGATIADDSGRQLTRDIASMSFTGSLDDGEMTVNLDGDAQIVLRGKFKVACSSCIPSEQGLVCGSSPEITAWCNDAKSQFGLE